MGFNARLRALVGIRPGSALASSIRNAAQIDVYGSMRRPGLFDVPPEEAVQLAEPVPWELQDGTGAVADWVNTAR
jgi:hypothetical protein